jgi:hypothetical protein
MDRGTRECLRFSRVPRNCAQFSAQLSRMKPTRIRMCHSLVMNYGLYKKMEIFVRIVFVAKIADRNHVTRTMLIST